LIDNWCLLTDSDLDQKMVENFVQEGIIMKNFNHPHVLSLLGLCLGFRKEPMVILPFMANGDLRTFVKDKSRVSIKVLFLFNSK
jgi:serine/threonine protein kinase